MLIMLLSMPLLMCGQTRLADGMVWRTKVTSTSFWYLPTTIQCVTIEETNDGDSFNVIRWKEEDPSNEEFIGSLKIEGEKVFLKSAYNTKWYLLYDFGLQPGEGCYVYAPSSSIHDKTPVHTYLKCVGLDDTFDSGKWTLMKMEEYDNEFCETYYGKGEWIKGLSSLKGFLWNLHFEALGGNGVLLDVTDNGTIIYSHDTTGVEAVAEAAEPQIRIDGNSLVVTANAPVDGAVYSASGIVVGNYSFGSDPTQIALPASGLYIVKIAKEARKIMIP